MAKDRATHIDVCLSVFQGRKYAKICTGIGISGAQVLVDKAAHGDDAASLDGELACLLERVSALASELVLPDGGLLHVLSSSYTVTTECTSLVTCIVKGRK
jgi:putative methionine-R-sulfoxide reductase with GAF domain